jgi:hypothetical protein
MAGRYQPNGDGAADIACCACHEDIHDTSTQIFADGTVLVAEKVGTGHPINLQLNAACD